MRKPQITLNHLHEHLLNINVQLVKIGKQLSHIQTKQTKTMATIQELNDKVTELQASIDAKQQQIADAIAAFEQTIKDLQDQINAGTGATPEQLQAVVDNLQLAKDDLEQTPTA